MAAKVPTVRFYNGTEMPIIGLGTWQNTDEEVISAVEHAIDVGYRHIDTAYLYGNEEAVGRALNIKMAYDGIKRGDLFVTTKLWAQFHSRGGVKEGFRRSLEALGLTYIDLFLVHLPVAFKYRDNELFPMDKNEVMTQNIDHMETWDAMEELYRSGLVKAIGLSNFNSFQIKRIYDQSRVKPMNVQVECNAYFPQTELRRFCRDFGISFTAYAPLGSPSKPKIPAPGQPAEFSATGPLFGSEVLSIAKRYGKQPAQVLLRNLIQRNIAVIPKSCNKHRIAQNFQILDFSLNEADMKAIKALGGRRPREFDLAAVVDHQCDVVDIGKMNLNGSTVDRATSYLADESVRERTPAATQLVLGLVAVPMIILLVLVAVYAVAHIRKPAVAPTHTLNSTEMPSRAGGGSTIPSQHNIYRSQSLDKYNMTEEIVAQLMKYNSRHSSMANTPVVRLGRVRPSNASAASNVHHRASSGSDTGRRNSIARADASSSFEGDHKTYVVDIWKTCCDGPRSNVRL